ncbi:alpha/beta-hydrolase [Ophiobolus disseminans]|uniref:Alpha/beta-hydrolase n=1 Tax=Ophiobolus disseminans TaxID=1469910 RepID=A0A6A6ZCU6_9PLEO|nr:alpha/beta-hydrolase [Ophiobolus disseminans]
MNHSTLLSSSSHAFPLWNSDPLANAFTFESPTDSISQAIVRSVTRPWIFAFTPTAPSNGRAILILGGGGYVELVLGREGIQVATWLRSLGFTAFVLVHRFPNAEVGPQAPLDDARQALRLIKEKGYGGNGVGVVGLSSGGHLGAALLATYPGHWTEKGSGALPELEFAVIGYGPISTNAVGRHIVKNKAPLEPEEKQELYDTVQPDVQLGEKVPPCFVVYSGSDAVVPVVNAYRLVEGLGKAGVRVELHVFSDAPHGFALDCDKNLPIRYLVVHADSFAFSAKSKKRVDRIAPDTAFVSRESLKKVG